MDVSNYSFAHTRAVRHEEPHRAASARKRRLQKEAARHRLDLPGLIRAEFFAVVPRLQYLAVDHFSKP